MTKIFTCLICLIVAFNLSAPAQEARSPESIRKEMARIRQTTHWDDPAAAKKANEEIKKLAAQLSAGTKAVGPSPHDLPTSSVPLDYVAKACNQASVVELAGRFFRDSYKKLDAIAKNRFDNEYKTAEKDAFSSVAVRKLSSVGAFQLQFAHDLDEPCAYLASAVSLSPLDTLAVNNFGAYLRMVDSIDASLSVLLYANSLYSQSPVILTQIGCSYFELKDYKKAELYLKEALKQNSNFGQASSALCDLYLQTGRWKDALQALFAAVVGNGISYGDAHGSFGIIKNASQGASGGMHAVSQGVVHNASAQQGGDDDKGDFWGENNLQIKPEDMLSSLQPDANIPDNEKLAPLVPEDYHLKMPEFSTITKLEDWTHGGGFNAAVSGYQAYMKTMMAYNSEFLKVQQTQPPYSNNATLRDYPDERFAIDCILEYFQYKSNKGYKRYDEEVSGLPGEAGYFIEDYFKKHENYRTEKENCLKASADNYEACKTQCTHYQINTPARETCNKNCTEQSKYADRECMRLYCLHDCNAANDCNTNMDGVYAQFPRTFSDFRKEQTKLLDDLYGFADPWLAKIYSPYWSKIYAYEINRVALGIIGNVYLAYQLGFEPTVKSDCGMQCSNYVIQPPVPVARVITRDMHGNECPDMGKHKFGFGICDLSFDCESVEFGCTEVVAVYAKRNFKKKTTSGFLGLGVKGSGGIIDASAKAGIEVTVNDNMEVEDVGAKMTVSVTTPWGPAKVGVSSTGSYTVMTGAKGKPSWGISGKAE